MSKLRADELESLSTGKSILVDEIDSGVRADLTSPYGAAMVGRGAMTVASIADLLALPEGLRKADLSYHVTGYRSGTTVGGGTFVWDASRPKADHNGSIVIDPDKTLPTNWNDPAQVDAWQVPSNVGTGCYVRCNTVTATPQMQGYDYGDGGVLRRYTRGISGSYNIVEFPFNDIAGPYQGVAILSGGGPLDQQLIGYDHNREVYTTAGSEFVWPHDPVRDVSDLRLLRYAAESRAISILVSPADYTATVGSGEVAITLASPLVDGEMLIVEDPLARNISSGQTPSLGLIIGGYDNVISSGVMHHMTGAHHRITGGDHGTLIGGSYSWIDGGNYPTIVGGTGHIVDGVGAGMTVVGGYRNKVSGGAGATAIGGQSNTISGAFSYAMGSFNDVDGTGSFAFGRNNVISSSDAFALGTAHELNHPYTSALSGYGAQSYWQGQTIIWAFRAGNSPKRQQYTLDISRTTEDSTGARMINPVGVSDFIPPDNSCWMCTARVSAFHSNGGGGAWEVKFGVRRDATTTMLIGSPQVALSVVDGSMTGANISVSIVNGGVRVTAEPPASGGNISWAGAIDVMEVVQP